MNNNNKRSREEENDNIASSVSFDNEATNVTIKTIMDLFGVKSADDLKELKPKVESLQREVQTLRGRLDNIVGALKPATTHALLETAVYMSVDGFDDNAKYGAAQQCSSILEALIDPNTKSTKSWVAPGTRRLPVKDWLPMMAMALHGLKTFVAHVDAETLSAWDPKKRNALLHNGELCCKALHVTPKKAGNPGDGHNNHDHLEEKQNVKKLLAIFEKEGKKTHHKVISDLRNLVEGGTEEIDITNLRSTVKFRIKAVAKAIREKKLSLDDDVVDKAIEFVLHLRYEN